VQERLRGFLRCCYDLRLIDRVPKLSPIKVDEPPTLPLTEKQYARMLKVIPEEFPHTKATRVHALIRLMRHSGLAIRDAVTLERAEFRWEAKPSFIVSLPIGRRPERMYRCRFPRRGDGDHRGDDAERKSQVRILEYGNGQATVCRHQLAARSATSLPSGGDQDDREGITRSGSDRDRTDSTR
jgi:hypothetical protein